jgi:hypothetical protein
VSTVRRSRNIEFVCMVCVLGQKGNTSEEIVLVCMIKMRFRTEGEH